MIEDIEEKVSNLKEGEAIIFYDSSGNFFVESLPKGPLVDSSTVEYPPAVIPDA